jgi:hypothetical protein
MSDYDDRRPTNVNVTPVVPPATAGGNGGLSFMVGALLVAVLAVGYFAMGMPGLKSPNEARAPDRKIDVTIQQPAPAAPATPAAPAAPAQPRQ